MSDFRSAVTAALGAAPESIEPGRFHRFSTNGKRTDTAGWCRLFDDGRAGVYGCHRQGISEVWTSADRAAMTRAERLKLARQVAVAAAERHARQREQWALNGQRNAQLWRECVPLVPGDPVTLYLKCRGLADAWPFSEVLRYHPELAYWHEGELLGRFPAMVGPIVALDGCIVALHRTYLTPDGRKADVPTVRKVTSASGPLVGACTPLHKPARCVLGVAEGIETALAAFLGSGVPTVAAYAASALAGFRWPCGVRRLVVFADNDAAGRHAAGELQSRAVRAGLQASVMTPTEPGADWCDVWTARGAVCVEQAA